MNILWLTWKDLKHPLAGGAERVNEELARRLVAAGHCVTLIVGGFAGGMAEEVVDGYRIIRLGNRYTVYLMAFFYFRKHLRGWPDLIIDEVNTVPFFGKWYSEDDRGRQLLFIHQLCCEIWFYQIFFPLNFIGYLIEPIYLWLLSDQHVITVSESTKRNLMKYAFKPENIHVISEGIELETVDDLASIQKYKVPTLLAFGAVRAMKRTEHIVRAFEIAKKEVPSLRLIIVGDAEDRYGEKIVRQLQVSKVHKVYKVNSKELYNLANFTNFMNDRPEPVIILGRVNLFQKLELMQKSHLIAVTSVKEGWGLIVTEANSQGTPAVGYDVDGLRDSIRQNETGLLTSENTPEALAREIVCLLKDTAEYERLRNNGWEWSREITFEKSFEDFLKVISP